MLVGVAEQVGLNLFLPIPEVFCDEANVILTMKNYKLKKMKNHE